MTEHLMTHPDIRRSSFDRRHVMIAKPIGPRTPEGPLPEQEISFMHGLAIVAVITSAALTMTSSMAAAATARLTAPDGADIGTVTLTETPNGVLLKAELRGLPQGEHGFHIHGKGACTPDFGAAGGHFAGGGGQHGYAAEDGPHAGDMPNIHVPASGELTIEVFMATFPFAAAMASCWTTMVPPS
jgi:Cu/Zn superoxide dismutase